MAKLGLTELFAPESQRGVQDYVSEVGPPQSPVSSITTVNCWAAPVTGRPFRYP
jgi:hypothetical protein